MLGLRHRSTDHFYSDSDDDRLSSPTSITSSGCGFSSVEPQLPSSLRKLLNPTHPSSFPSHTRSQFSNLSPSGLPSRLYHSSSEGQENNDLARLRPWKKLPPPPVKTQPAVSLPPIYLCLPRPKTSDWPSHSCSPQINPHSNPYYLPPPTSYREPHYRFTQFQSPVKDGEFSNRADAPVNLPTALPSFSSSWPPNNSLVTDHQAKAKARLNTSSYDAPSPRSVRVVGCKKRNNSQEKERNRCLTCGSSFSTFANLTRHEKKCPMATSRAL